MCNLNGNLTAKDAVINITIRLNGEREDFFLYDSRSYTAIINAINQAQQDELCIKTLRQV